MKIILIRNFWKILKETFSEFMNDKVLKFSAALAYYTVFSLPSMLVLVIGLCSIFFGRDAIQGEIFNQIDHLVGTEAAVQIQQTLRNTTLRHDNVWITVFGSILLISGATGIFGEIQDSINAIWGLKANPKRGLLKIFFNRLISFSMVIVLGFILMVSLLLNALLGAFLQKLKSIFSEELVDSLFFIDYLLMFTVISTLFASIFKILPDAKILWKDVAIGSIVTATLFMGGKFLIGYYMQHNASITAYGAAGAIIVLLLWVYYSAIILYFGAEFTQVYVRHMGRSIEPNRYANWIETKFIKKESNTGHKPEPEVA